MLSFWGKAKPSEGSAHPWHPVAYHSLDVAACADALLALRAGTLARGAEVLGLDVSAAHGFLVAITSLHDLGKFANAFQIKRPDLWPSVLGPADVATPPSAHTEDGLVLWDRHLRDRIAERLWIGDPHALSPLMQAVFGHHGRPLDPQVAPLQARYRDAGVAAAEVCALELLRLLHPQAVRAPELSDRAAAVASWWLAGFVTLADWVGSNQDRFPYCGPAVALQDYWNRARDAARDAVCRAGLVPPRVSRARGLAAVTGLQRPPTPLQKWATDVVLPGGPVLVIIEDVTGAGKTEAAQMLVHQLLRDGRVSGAYWAMPTQATANAMYERQHLFLNGLFDAAGPRPSLALAHGQQKLHAGFQRSVLRDLPSVEELRADREDDDAELNATASCAAFLADDRRASLVADVGAGTIDQAVLSVLASKFNTVRLLGLCEKVLVLDEVHGYDAYMLAEVKALLAFQATLGGSAIVLSATLPHKLRQELVDAWRSAGMVGQFAPAERPVCNAYPMVTTVSGSGEVAERAIEAAPWSTRHVDVDFVHDSGAAVERIVSAQKAGAAVAWIRNTVDSCVAAADMLRARGIEPLVFHARFAQCDRQAREAEVLRIFGVKDQPERRGRVLIATQVIEQSLDLDFDVMISDLAPIDLLIQRAGRLWRHEPRNSTRTVRGPRLTVLAPPFSATPDKEWLKDVLPHTQLVYDRVDVLWRSLRALDRSPVIRTPEGLRNLVEEVYAGDECPATLVDGAGRAHGRESAARSMGGYATLPLVDGYTKAYRGWQSEIRVRTRLDDESTVIRLARVASDGRLLPWADADGPPWRAWALSEVRVSLRRVPPMSATLPSFEESARRVRADWGRFEQEIVVVPMSAGADGWQGILLRPDGKRLTLRYTVLDGLTFE